jgi:hypothetical protein
MECWNDGILGSKSGKTHFYKKNSFKPILAKFHHSTIPIGAKPLSSND